MPAYAAAIPRPPRTLTEVEQAALLKVTGEHRDGFRDHVIFAVALGTGLREHEIAALDVGDVLHEDGRVRRRIALRTFKRSSTDGHNRYDTNAECRCCTASVPDLFSPSGRRDEQILTRAT
jgi:integrase